MRKMEGREREAERERKRGCVPVSDVHWLWLGLWSQEGYERHMSAPQGASWDTRRECRMRSEREGGVTICRSHHIYGNRQTGSQNHRKGQDVCQLLSVKSYGPCVGSNIYT